VETEAPRDQTYRIPAHNLERLQSVVAKLNKRAAKHGLTPIVLKEVGQQTYVKTDEYGVEHHLILHEVRIIGETPTIAGWTFLATLEHVGEAGTIVRTVPWESVPERYRSADPRDCDVCHQVRSRLETFVLRNKAGEYKQVGRNCLAVFFGGQDAHSVAEMAELLIAVEAACSEGEWDGGMGGGEARVPSGFFLALTAGAIRTYGWCSKSQALSTDCTPTVARVLTRIDRMRGIKPKYDDDPRDAYEITEEDRKLAADAADFATGYFSDKTDLDDYSYNLSVVAKLGSVNHKQMGLLASLIPWYQRQVGFQAEVKARAEKANTSTYVGEVGGKVQLTVTVLHVIDRANDYGYRGGTTHIHKMADAAGNALTWFSSSDRLEEGQTYVLKGTVKAQEEYKGEKQTVLTRCTVIAPCESCGKDGKQVWANGGNHFYCAKCYKCVQKEEERQNAIRNAENDETWLISSIQTQEEYLKDIRGRNPEPWIQGNIVSTETRLVEMRANLAKTVKELAQLRAS
jgi:hypothetical protein